MLTLDAIKAELLVSKDYCDLDEKAWLDRIAYRGITRNSQRDIDGWKKLYPRKIAAVREELANGVVVDSPHPLTKEQYAAAYDEKVAYLRLQEARLLDKLACVLKEEEYRTAGVVARENLHDQGVYYIDFVDGDDANDGLTTGTAWKTINKYTTVTARTAGDIAYVRANRTLTQNTASITFDEDGTPDAWIEIVGCDAVTNDPWGDGSNVKPIIDFNDAAYHVYCFRSAFWRFTRLDLRQSNHGDGTVMIAANSSGEGNSSYVKLVECDISDNAASTVEGITVVSGGHCILEGCTFVDTFGPSISVYDSYLHAKNCVLNKGSVRNTALAVTVSGGVADFENCTFGLTTTYSTQNFRTQYGGQIRLRNCEYAGTFGGTTPIQLHMTSVVSEDDDAVFGEHLSVYPNGTINKATSSPRSGGASSYARLTPKALSGVISPLVLGDPMTGFAPIWMEAASASTITVYIRGSNWATEPGNSAGQLTCYLKASYLNNAASAARTEILSAQDVANDDTTWTAFSVTIPAGYPKRDGFVYLWVCLGAYESGEYIDVDIKPIVS